MASTLRMCLVLHIEEQEGAFDQDKAQTISSLAVMIGTGTRHAKLSVQMGAEFATRDNAAPPNYNASTSSLGAVLDKGGNFWLHMHTSDATYLHSARLCVMSLYRDENVNAGSPDPSPASVHVSGRSSGTGAAAGGADWVAIAVNEGLRAQNCGTFENYVFMPQSLRPYGFSDDEIDKLYFHDVAPGPIHLDIGTMRMRPFWMEQTTKWFARTDSTFPHIDFVSSLMMIPKPARFSRIAGTSQGRSASSYTTLTMQDLDCCLTEIWSVWNQKQTSQNSITNVWYKLLATEDLTHEFLETIGPWIESVNDVMQIPGVAQRASWENMNDIANLFSHTTSFYY